MLRIAHLSDPHFAKLQWSFKQFLSKEWLGNGNLLLKRKYLYQPEAMLANISTWLEQQKVEYIFITGDFTTTSQPSEFELAKLFLQKLDSLGLKFYILPGNHDKYTKESDVQQRFYKFFSKTCNFAHKSSVLGSYSLKDHGIEGVKLQDNWWLIGIDSIRSTPFFASWGVFSEQIEQTLDEALGFLKGEKVIMLNHYPLLNLGGWRRNLKRYAALQKLLRKHTQVKLYLHGHTHIPAIYDEQANQLPLILDSGSCSHVKKGSFNLIELQSNSCQVNHVKPVFDMGAFEKWNIEKKMIFNITR
ncbi:MAG: hypothetical protein K0S74_276 [Chlamydiales bacterium]|jgi:3',5'-cyclic AMP phosphodiesterase CpdA|nr:hypothetical protein [Chlamydiales bacterium]